MSPGELWLAIVGVALIVGLIFLAFGATVGGWEARRDRAGESGFCSGACFEAWWLEQNDLAEYEHAIGGGW
jgi:L-asparagine transporter-like permease